MHIGIRSLLSDLKAKHAEQHRKIKDFWQFLVFVSFLRPALLMHTSSYQRANLAFKQITSAFEKKKKKKKKLRRRGGRERRITASAEHRKQKNFYKKNEYISWNPFISHFHLCFMFAPVVCVFFHHEFFFVLRLRLLFLFSCVATKLKSKHKVGYVTDISWLRAPRQ